MLADIEAVEHMVRQAHSGLAGYRLKLMIVRCNQLVETGQFNRPHKFFEDAVTLFVSIERMTCVRIFPPGRGFHNGSVSQARMLPVPVCISVRSILARRHAQNYRQRVRLCSEKPDHVFRQFDAPISLAAGFSPLKFTCSFSFAQDEAPVYFVQ